MPRRDRRGFTLIEVVVALGVLVVMAGLAWETLGGALALRNYFEEEQQIERAGQVAMNRISRELSLAFLTENVTAVNTYQTVFVGRDNDDEDEIFFATKSHRRTMYGSRESDQTEITIWLEEDPENPGQSILLHREAQRIDNEPDRDGAILPLARAVSRFDLRYLDPTTNEWLEEWDTQGTTTPNRLPRAMQVVLVIAGPHPEDEDETLDRIHVRTVIIEMADEIDQSAFAGNGQ